MKILHIYKAALPESMGGIEQVINTLAVGVLKQGVIADVLSLSAKKSYSTDYRGYKIYYCNQDFLLASTGFSLQAIYTFWKLSKRADIIHFHFPWPYMDLMFFLLRLKNPSIVTYHSDIVKQKILLNFYKPLKNWFLSNVDLIISTSPNYLVTSDVLKRYVRKVEVIPIGLEKNSYPSINIERLKYWKNLVGERFFLFIGVLRYYKGLKILLDALALRDLPFVIIGSGPIEAELKIQAVSLGLKNVVFLGFVADEDKVALIHLSYAMVFPSHMRSEAFGVSLLEGAMFGKPMISSEIGTGTCFVNVNQVTGIVVAPASSNDLHKAMVYLWDNPEIATQMGLKAAERFEQLFTADKMCQAYVEIYRRLINKNIRNL